MSLVCGSDIESRRPLPSKEAANANAADARLHQRDESADLAGLFGSVREKKEICRDQRSAIPRAADDGGGAIPSDSSGRRRNTSLRRPGAYRWQADLARFCSHWPLKLHGIYPGDASASTRALGFCRLSPPALRTASCPRSRSRRSHQEAGSLREDGPASFCPQQQFDTE